MKIYDCHIHSDNSVDGKNSVDEICKTAIAKGVTSITITDHATPMPAGIDDYSHIENCVKEARIAAEKYKDQLLVLVGAEREDKYPADFRERFYDFELDCVLGSAHSKATFYEHFPDSGYIDILDCSKSASIEFIKEVVRKYYHRLTEIAYYADVDVITHLTFLFRYINGYNNRGLETELFYPEIDNILKGVIERGKSLEINTSGKALSWNKFMPDAEILKRYYNMGGRFITIGSDAHNCENLGQGIEKGIDIAKICGFKYYTIFENRKPKVIEI